MGKKIKEIYKNIEYKWAFWIGFFVSIGLLITSFFIPPLGIIHPSILQGVAEIGFFAVLAIVADSVKTGSDFTLSKGDIKLQMNNPDPNEKTK